jgi:hypothetical protein
MQMHATIGELVVIAVIALLALFWLIPILSKGIINRAKRIFGRYRERD